jgi:hypothetical protein
MESGPGIQGGNGSRTAHSTRSAPDVTGGIGAGSIGLTRVEADGSNKYRVRIVHQRHLKII